ncbi:hypothetical protein F4823DRAFT_308052 [Ustulina deusta]|nr:hypothetical protein F4823DRAFT_308052 [Ustulina deusta]
MDTNTWSLQPVARSKRPSPSPDVGDREAKIPRRGSREEDADGKNPANELSLPLYDPPQQTLCCGYEDQYENSAANQFGIFNPSEGTNVSPESIARTDQMLLDNSYVPPEQPDISMENYSFWSNQFQIGSFGEISPSMNVNNAGGLQEDISDGNATAALNIPYRLDASQDYQSVFSEWGIGDVQLQNPVDAPLDEPIDVCSNYDTCFGVR